MHPTDKTIYTPELQTTLLPKLSQNSSRQT